MLQDFKKFIMRGNVMDLAVGVIIGAAFGKIVDSLVNDMIMPIFGIILKGVDFANLYYVISAGSTPGPYASLDAAKKAGAAVLAYGNFINTVVYFMIIGFVIFWMVKVMNNLIKKQDAPAVPPPPAEDVVLLREIRDSLVRVR
ncbi:MAG: large conductance mechanosensitive channel protein MscL [Burkholderiales bacterium]